MGDNSNPYEVLGVSSLLSKELIKKKYRELVKYYHPDEPTGDETMFKQVKEAWKDIEKNHEVYVKRQLDRWIHKSIFTIRRLR